MSENLPADIPGIDPDIDFMVFLANAPFGIFVADGKGLYTYVNETACRITGYTKGELVGKNLIELIHPDDRNAAAEHFSQVRNNGPVTGEFRYISKSGNIRYWEVKAAKISDTRFIGFTTDTTERKSVENELLRKNEELQATFEELSSTEEELKQQLEEILSAQTVIEEREQKYRRLVNASEAGIALHEIICDEMGIPVDYRFIEVNPAFERMTGLIGAEVTGRTVREILPGIEESWIYTYGEVALTGKTVNFDDYSKDLGRYYHVTAYAPVKGQFATLVMDVTEQKLQEIHIQETNSYLENLITFANVPIIVWDPDFRITRINHAFEHLIGTTSENIVDKSLEILFPPDQADRSMRLIRTTLEGVRWETVEIQLLHQSGDIRTVLWNSSTIYSSDGKTPLATIAQGRDVTLERQFEREKDAAAVQIQENIAKLAILNDGIRNPLTIISTFVDMAVDTDSAEHIQAEIRRIDDMVSNLDREWIKSEKILNFLKKHDVMRTGYDPGHYSESPDFNPALQPTPDPQSVQRYDLFIEELQAQLYTILDSIDALIYVADLETYEILYLNKQGRYSYGTVLGQKCYSFFQRDMNGPCPFCTNHLLVNEKGATGVYRWEYFNERNNRWYDCRDRAIRWTDGRLVRLEIATDITELKAANEEIEEKNKEINRFFDSNLDLLLIADTDGHIKKVNPEWESTLGYPVSELEGKRFLDLVHPDDLKDTLEAVATLENQTTILNFVNRYRHKDGSYRYIEWRSFPYGKTIYASARDITEPRIAEEKLRLSEEKFRRIVDTAEEGIWQMDDRKNTVYVNHRMAEMLGYTPDEMIGRHVTSFMPPGEISSHAERMKHRVRGENDRYDQQFVKKDGSIIWMHVSATALVNDDGTFQGSFAMFTDITEQKNAEEALKESENRFYELFNNMPAAVAVYQQVNDGVDFVFRDFNHAAEKIEQIRKEELIGRKVTEIFPGVIEFGLYDVFKRVYETGNPERLPISLYQDNRIAGWKENYVYKLPSGEIVAIYEDVTEQKQFELDLRRSEEEFRDLANSITDVFFAMDSDLRYTFWNRASEVLTGIPAEKAIGKRIDEIFPGEVGSRSAKIYQEVLNTKIGTSFISSYAKDGNDLFFEISVYPTIRGISVFSKDITRQKRLQDTAQESAKKILLLTSISRHDIMNELNAMAIVNDFALESSDISYIHSQVHQFRESIERIEKVISFTRDYDDFAFTTSRWLLLHSIITSAQDEISLGAVRCEMSITDSLEIYADMIIRKVFSTILENAIRHGKTLTNIRLFTDNRAGDLVIICEDNGIGIPFYEKEEIFSYGHGKNTGIGLFLAKEILNLSSFGIRETGEETKGARFEITVPQGKWRVRELVH